jgi:hypothetical protein
MDVIPQDNFQPEEDFRANSAELEAPGLYLVYRAHLSPLWCWLPIGWMGANTESRYGRQKRILAFENKTVILLHIAQI